MRAGIPDNYPSTCGGTEKDTYVLANCMARLNAEDAVLSR
jgi:hypothetical protein